MLAPPLMLCDGLMIEVLQMLAPLMLCAGLMIEAFHLLAPLTPSDRPMIEVSARCLLLACLCLVCTYDAADGIQRLDVVYVLRLTTHYHSLIPLFVARH